jgi:hypothetical protein
MEVSAKIEDLNIEVSLTIAALDPNKAVISFARIDPLGSQKKYIAPSEELGSNFGGTLDLINIPENLAFVSKAKVALENILDQDFSQLNNSVVHMGTFVSLPYNLINPEKASLASLMVVLSKGTNKQVMLFGDKMSNGKIRVTEVLDVKSATPQGVQGSRMMQEYFGAKAIENQRRNLQQQVTIRGKEYTFKVESEVQETIKYFNGLEVSEVLKHLENLFFIAEPDSIQKSIYQGRSVRYYTLGFLGPSKRIYGVIVYQQLDHETKQPYYRVVSVFEYWRKRLLNNLNPRNEVQFLDNLP